MMILAGPGSAAISGLSVVTNMTPTDRIPVSQNWTINISFTESVMTAGTNIQFPPGYNLGGLVLADITNNTGLSTAVSISGQWVNLTYDAKDAGLIYFYFTKRVNPGSVIGQRSIRVQTNATTSASYTYLCSVDKTKPYFVSMNNTDFTSTCASQNESQVTQGDTLYLSGTGVANLTFYVSNITGQTNATQGYKVTNATSVRIVHTTDTTPNQTMYVITDGTVTDPIIIISAANELETANLVAPFVAAAMITLTIIYYRRRRTR